MTTTTPVAQTTKAIRAELKTAYPGHKFSVTCKNFSMGSSFRVTWIDGVTKGQVEEITRKYDQVRRCDISGEILGGGNTYAHIERSYSPAVMQPELDRISKKYVVRNWRGEEVSEMATHISSDGSMSLAECYTVGDNRGNTVRSLLAETLDKTSYYQAPEGKKAVNNPNETVLRSIEDNEIIMEYLFPEDAIATDCGATVTENPEKDGVEVKFDRKPDSATLDALKGNGFRYSRNLNIWYAKRTAKTLRVAHSFSSIVDSIPVTKSTPTDFSYLLGAESEQLAQDVAAIEAEEIDREISAPRRTVLSLMPAVEIEEDKAIPSVVTAIEPEVIEDPNLSVSEFREAANSGKVISLFAFATAIRREQTPVPAIEPEVIEDPNLSVSEFEQAANSGKVISLFAFATAIHREQTPVPAKPSCQVVDTFSIEPVVIEQPKPKFEVIRTPTASGLTAWY